MSEQRLQSGDGPAEVGTIALCQAQTEKILQVLTLTEVCLMKKHAQQACVEKQPFHHS